MESLERHGPIVEFLGTKNELGIGGPIGLYVGTDQKSPDEYIIIAGQSGLGMPDRDYYFDQTKRGTEVRDRYVEFVSAMLRLSGHTDADAAAARILALEVQLAEHHWDKVRNRDAEKTYNKLSGTEFAELLSNFGAESFLAGVGAGPQAQLIVRQPSYFTAFNDLFLEVPLTTWQEYLRLQVMTSYAGFLNEEVVDINFDFYGKTLQGREQQQVRWKRAISSINANLGELLGRLYVEKHFPPEAKRRMDKLVENLTLAYAESIRRLDWMSDDTKTKALEKLSKFTPMIGYPDTWRD